MKRLVPLAFAFSMFGAACASTGIILYEGPDRPGGEEVEGPARPSDYKFGPIERVIDTNGDKKPDRLEFYADGKLTGVAEDSNFDGKFDVYKMIVNGKVVDEVRDQNYDGTFDIRSRDTNGDGTLDHTETIPAAK